MELSSFRGLVILLEAGNFCINKRDNSITGISISRDGLEPLIRRLLLEDPRYSNVTWKRATLTGLRLDPTAPDKSKFVGIIARNPDGSEEHLDGSLIVDASGPTNISVKLLSRLPKPVVVQQTSYDPGQIYRFIIVPVSEKTQYILAKGGYVEGVGSRATK